jgi:ATP-dependent RNA helicase RhlE
VSQIAYPVSEDQKRAAVVHLVKSRKLNQVIVFSNTKIGTARLARQLERDGVRAESIHGDKSQAERIKALEAFKAGELEVLVATDVAARGLDVAGVPCVINYDLPYNAEDYVHRIGRTGRAGAKGDAIALYTPAQEKLLLEVERLIKRPIERADLDLPQVSAPRSRTRSHSAPQSKTASTPVDEFFLKPYEPSTSTTNRTAAPAANKPSADRKAALGVLLGAAPRPPENKAQSDGSEGET